MEDWIKVSAKTVEDAVMEASIQLGTSRNNIEYRVIERETKGFLGIGAKPAVIEARGKAEEEDIVKEVFSEKAPEVKQAAPKQKEQKAAPAEKKEAAPKKAAAKSEKTEKPVAKAAPAKEEKAENAAPKQEKAEKPVKAEKKPQAEKKAAPKKNVEKKAAPAPKAERRSEPKAPRVPADPAEAIDRAENFLKEMFAAMNMKVDISSVFEEDTLSIELSGEDMGILIGKRGQTLDSVQYLTSLVVNKGKASYVRVKVDTEDYRERRKATLENLAKNIAFKVKKTGRPVYLEPMNPYERRIIHAALQNDPYVTTHSEGEEPCRKVVVTMKKRAAAEDAE